MPKFKAMASRNYENRQCLKMPHRAGRTPFSIIDHKEMKSTGVQPSKLRMFELTHQRNGEYVEEEAKSKMNQCAEYIKERDTGKTKMTDEDIFIRSFGFDKRGRLHCKGMRPASIKSFGSTSNHVSLLQETKKEAVDAKREAAEARKEADEARIQAIEAVRRADEATRCIDEYTR